MMAISWCPAHRRHDGRQAVVASGWGSFSTCKGAFAERSWKLEAFDPKEAVAADHVEQHNLQLRGPGRRTPCQLRCTHGLSERVLLAKAAGRAAVARSQRSGSRACASSSSPLDPRVHPYHGRRQVEEGILWYAQAVNHQAGDG
ncbi:hypothetical protein PG985_006357 [Apiospora marii]|uniref:uncharacterized protein n=1 Tax=Apiospora marii TaxID=335849 RepID=UPI00312D3497